MGTSWTTEVEAMSSWSWLDLDRLNYHKNQRGGTGHWARGARLLFEYDCRRYGDILMLELPMSPKLIDAKLVARASWTTQSSLSALHNSFMDQRYHCVLWGCLNYLSYLKHSYWNHPLFVRCPLFVHRLSIGAGRWALQCLLSLIRK